MNTSRGPSQSEITESGNVVVEARTIDTLVERKNIPPPQLIKFDVEGHEKQALRGAINTLTRYRPVVLCDYNDDTTLGAVSNILELLGYNIRTGSPIIAIPNKL